MQQWNLGAYHYSRVLSPFTAALRPDLEAQYDVGHAPRGGDSYTINATGGTDNQPAGGSFKIVMDTENWDNSVGLNNPGQSGDIASPHYRDLYELWARGKYFPIFYSRVKVESVAEQSVTLTPEKTEPWKQGRNNRCWRVFYRYGGYPHTRHFLPRRWPSVRWYRDAQGYYDRGSGYYPGAPTWCLINFRR